MAEEYETHIVGCGGTKTAYQVTEDHVIYFPNEVDGKWLEDRWNIIMEDEFFASEYFQTICVPVIKFTKHHMTKENGTQFVTYGSESFSSMAKKGTYVVDIKKKSYWKSANQNKNFDEWIMTIKPLVKDVLTLAKYGVYPSYDSQNIIFITKDSEYYTQTGSDIEARIFLFDLTSKRVSLDRKNYRTENLTSLPMYLFTALLRKYIETCVAYYCESENYYITYTDTELINRLIQYVLNNIDYDNFIYKI